MQTQKFMVVLRIKMDNMHQSFMTPSQYSHLVKDLSDVGLRLSKPHGEQLRSFDGDEICLALIGDGFGQQSLTTTGGTVEEHTFGWGHAKLEELVWMLHWVLNLRRGEGIKKTQ